MFGRIKYIFLLSFVFFLFQCTEEEKVPKDIMNKQEMASAMLKIHMAEHLLHATSMNYDTALVFYHKNIKPRVFDSIPQDSAVFAKSYDYYVRNPKMFKGVYDIIIDSLSVKKELLEQN